MLLEHDRPVPVRARAVSENKIMKQASFDSLKTASAYVLRLKGYWDVGHTKSVSSRVLEICFQPDKVRLVGLRFNSIDPLVISISLITNWMHKYSRKT